MFKIKNCDTVLKVVILLIILGSLYLFLDKRQTEDKFTNYIRESFISSSKESSDQSVAAGASMEYGWGYKTIAAALEKAKDKTPAPTPSGSCPSTTTSTTSTTTTKSSSTECKAPAPGVCSTTTTESPQCPPTPCENKCFSAKKPEFCSQIGECPIEKHPDFHKYVLKSSIPPPPDMSEYILKTEIPPQPNMKEYMLRKDCKPLPQPDMTNYMLKSECKAYHKDWNRNDYVLKSEIEACPTCPTCPEPQKFYTPAPTQTITNTIYTPSPSTNLLSPSSLDGVEIQLKADEPTLYVSNNDFDKKHKEIKSKWNNKANCDLGKFFF